ncbi:hypothetical protein [Amycolatopsis sp. cg9]|uniref:hypothetical protein n=1 Tax=Amycolatopsis sp. cg9 TaxID=3238801 RepID=UPI003523D4C4
MEFVIAEDDVWLSAFGAVPQTEEASGDDFVRELRIPVSVTEELHLTWDVNHRSVRFRYARATKAVTDLYREGATLLTVGDQESGAMVVLKYRADGCRGRTCVRTQPAFALKDTFLWS